MKEIKNLVSLGIIFSLAIMFSLSPESVFASTAAAQVGSDYSYYFNTNEVVSETGKMDSSNSPYWWVNSGAKMIAENGLGGTLQGSLPTDDYWRLLYAANNPTDTDNGYHPQNIFRFVTRNKWQNATQEVYFLIKADNLSISPNRNVSNGVLLFNRYQDGDNLYYTGIRVDGSAIIKKKINGRYYTMAEIKNFYPGAYSRISNPNLLPKNKWIGVKSEVKNIPGGSVSVKLYADKGWTGVWQLVAQVVDDGTRYGSPITNYGYGGIRTDFMDVKFENFKYNQI